MAEEAEAREEEAEKLLEDFCKTIRSIVNLSPSYNLVTRALREGKGEPTAEVREAYPEILETDLLPVLGEFGITIGANFDIGSSSVASDVMTLVNRIEGSLDREEVRDAIGRATGEMPPNPRRDYVKGCVESLREEDETALKILRIASREYSLDLDDAVKKMEEEFGIKIDEEGAYEHSGILDNYGLLDSLDKKKMSIKEHYKKHVLDVAEI